ncbi:hypothetical protein [Shewanella pealeana]|uniref:hypothetical protein n=1 Tax=Shewanella pealeana TaxID=70864 RepID=UPI00167F6E76|nr:hypothetical protein [Shewanella pealeana]
MNSSIALQTLAQKTLALPALAQQTPSSSACPHSLWGFSFRSQSAYSHELA